MIEIPTDFSYKGDRTYVHSTTMGEFLSARVCPQLGLKATEVLLDAQFHRVVTKNGVMRCLDAPNQLCTHAEIAAEFRLVSGAKTYHVYFIEDDKPVESRIDPKYEIEDWQNPTPFEGTCRINISSTRAFFENTIEANKRLHQAAYANKLVKITNLYMKKVPLGIRSDDRLYTLKIRHLGARTHNDGLTTLNKFSFVGMDIPEFQMCYFVSEVIV